MFCWYYYCWHYILAMHPLLDSIDVPSLQSISVDHLTTRCVHANAKTTPLIVAITCYGYGALEVSCMTKIR